MSLKDIEGGWARFGVRIHDRESAVNGVIRAAKGDDALCL